MKRIIGILFLCVAFSVLLTACSSGPPKAYQCVDNSDCMVVKNSIKENQCCMFDAINANYQTWYKEKEGARLMCIKPCDLDPSTVQAACVKNLCTVVHGRVNVSEELS